LKKLISLQFPRLDPLKPQKCSITHSSVPLAITCSARRTEHERTSRNSYAGFVEIERADFLLADENGLIMGRRR